MGEGASQVDQSRASHQLNPALGGRPKPGFRLHLSVMGEVSTLAQGTLHRFTQCLCVEHTISRLRGKIFTISYHRLTLNIFMWWAGPALSCWGPQNLEFDAPNIQYIAFYRWYLYKQKRQFISTNVYKSMFLQHQHNKYSRETSAFSTFQARKMTFACFLRCKCFCQRSHIQFCAVELSMDIIGRFAVVSSVREDL